MTARDDLIEMIGEAPVFRDLSPDMIAKLAGCARVEHYDAGAVLIRDGQPAETFFAIRHGKVALELAAPPHGRLVLQTLQEGDVLGWSWLVPPYRWAFDGRAVTLVRTLSFDARGLDRLMGEDTQLGYRLLRELVTLMANRLTTARMQMLDLYTPRGD